MTLSSALFKAFVRHSDRCALVATRPDLHQLLVCAGLTIAARSRVQKEQPLLFCAKVGKERFLTLIECKHAAAVQNKDAFNRVFCSLLSACSRATFECLLLALQADPPLPGVSLVCMWPLAVLILMNKQAPTPLTLSFLRC